MLQRALILLTQLCTGVAVFFVLEGFAWVEEGYGLHPMLAGALVALLLLVPHLLPIMYEEDNHGQETP